MKKIGFTLAEVIVTLAIIGVITALVLPQFISRTHNQANASKLSTIITDYENIFGMMLVKENKNDIFETEFGRAWTGNNQAGMKVAMEKYSKIAHSSQDNNTKSLGYLSSLMNNLMPKAFAKPTSQGGLTAVPSCPNSKPMRVQIPSGTDLGRYLQCNSQYCCSYQGEYSGQEYLCCSTSCPTTASELVESGPSPRTGCINAATIVDNGAEFLPKNFWCCPPEPQGCPVDEITSWEQYEAYCYCDRCPCRPPELCFTQCQAYKCGTFGLQYNADCHYGMECANALKTLCKCANKNETVSETGGTGCSAAGSVNATHASTLDGGCSSTNYKPQTMYCCTEQTTTCPAGKTWSQTQFTGGNCTQNLGSEGGYCCEYAYPCTDESLPILVSPGNNYDGCQRISGKNGRENYDKWYCCPEQMSCNSGETLIQNSVNAPWDGCRKVQSASSSLYAWCCQPQKPSCPAEYPNLTDANGEMPSNCIIAGTTTSGAGVSQENSLKGVVNEIKKALGLPEDYNNAYWCCKKEEKQCAGGGQYFETMPSSNEYDCKAITSGYCCEKKGSNCDDPCATGCYMPQQCCEANGKHWANNTCCDNAHYYNGTCNYCPSNKPNYDGTTCCDNAHYYDNACHKCKQGYSLVYGFCVKDPDPIDCDKDPNHEECCKDKWDSVHSQCCDEDHYYGAFIKMCHNCLEGKYEYDGGCHNCKKEQYEYDGSCHNCPEGAHEVDRGWGKFECITCSDDTTWNGTECVKQDSGTEPTPTSDAKPTPFHKITKQKATTDEISFSYAEMDSVTGANMLYGDVSSYNYKDAAGKTTTRKAATIYIDVNGKSGPNMFGIDVFAVVLDQDGHIYPYGSEKAAIILTGPDNAAANTWKGTTDRYGCTTKPYGGLGCTARLVENNFKVDY